MTVAGFLILQAQCSACVAQEAALSATAVDLSASARATLLDTLINGSMTLDQTKLMAYGSAILVSGLAAGFLIGRTLGVRAVGRCNHTYKLDESKVVHSVDIEDVGKKRAFCRCWKSTTMPYCDGTHNKHNEATGDNVGPLLVSNKAAA